MGSVVEAIVEETAAVALDIYKKLGGEEKRKNCEGCVGKQMVRPERIPRERHRSPPSS
jgi:hypothetical protein